MKFPEVMHEQIKSSVRTVVQDLVSSKFRNIESEFEWGLQTYKVFHYDVRLVLLALDKMCEAFDLDFDPYTLPQKSIFETFPRIANFCAYLEFRLAENMPDVTVQEYGKSR